MPVFEESACSPWPCFVLVFVYVKRLNSFTFSWSEFLTLVLGVFCVCHLVCAGFHVRVNCRFPGCLNTVHLPG